MTKQGAAQSRQSGTETEERRQKGQEGEVFTDAGYTNLNTCTTGITQKGCGKVPNTVYLVFSDVFKSEYRQKEPAAGAGLWHRHDDCASSCRWRFFHRPPSR